MTKSNRYWELRQEADMFHYMEQAEDAASRMTEIYRKASNSLSLDAEQIFEKFMTKHNLTEKEALDLLSRVQDKASIDALLQELRNSPDTKEKQELLSKLEAPAYQARIERLRQIQNQLDVLMRTVYGLEKDISTKFYTDLGNESYYRNMYNMQQRVDAAFGFGHLSEKQIDRVLNSKWQGGNYSSRIWKNTQALSQNIKEELLLSFITGKTYSEVADIIGNKFAQGAHTAKRLVRTEANFVASEFNAIAYEEAGVKEYLFLATLDLRTSEKCRGLDGLIFEVAKRAVGVNCPPMHPFCRSTTIAVINRKLLDKMTRAARDPVTGKTIRVPMNMTFEHWYEKYVEGGGNNGRSTDD